MKELFDLFQRQNEVDRQGATNTTAEELLYLQPLLAKILAVDPYLTDLVFDYRCLLRNSC